MALTNDEIAGLKAIVTQVWGASVANSINYNYEVAEVVRTAVEQISICSAAIKGLFELLADAALGKLFSLPWLLGKSVSIAATLANAANNAPNRACINSTAAAYRTSLEMASLGL
uniref:hypothetical protein n=1 Tax=Pseudomonas sp. RW407 TaxID=2202894 RepID=UPI0011B60C3B|nr:hypothetical protein [Pseudomonas sp. RW407]